MAVFFLRLGRSCINPVGVSLLSKSNAVLIAILLVLSSTSGAVLIDSGDGTGNTKAPTPDPGWRNIGVANGLTVTYLGEGWVLSAAHVGEKTVAVDGGVYPPVAGSQVVLRHAGDVESDVELFRIDPYPKQLLPLPVRKTAIAMSEPVLMVGNGRNRGEPIHWKNQRVHDGYAFGEGKGMRWGTNIVSGAEIDLVAMGKTTRSIYTDFTPAGTRHEAHATAGDSGGPVFTRAGSRWELAGVIFATNGFAGQPPTSVIYGNRTYASDLSYYRDQIVEVMTPDCGNGHLTIDEECDDGNLTGGDCCSAQCTFEPRETPCDDGLQCTQQDHCDGAGTCVSEVAISCDDGDACTEDRCEEATGCRHVPFQGPECSPPGQETAPR